MTRQLWNQTKDTIVVKHLEIAMDPWSRMRGLLGRNIFDEGHGLLIEECWMIHTWFVKFPLDIVFIDRELRVRKTVAGLEPWKFTWCWASAHTLELPAGTLERISVDIEDVILIEKING